VGRQFEWQQLQAAWKRAVNGDAHLALITGEAGIGKSRLAEELFSWVRRQGFATAYSRSYGVEGRLPWIDAGTACLGATPSRCYPLHPCLEDARCLGAHSTVERYPMLVAGPGLHAGDAQ